MQHHFRHGVLAAVLASLLVLGTGVSGASAAAPGTRIYTNGAVAFYLCKTAPHRFWVYARNYGPFVVSKFFAQADSGGQEFTQRVPVGRTIQGAVQIFNADGSHFIGWHYIDYYGTERVGAGAHYTLKAANIASC